MSTDTGMELVPAQQGGAVALPSAEAFGEDHLHRMVEWATKLASASLCPVHLKIQPNQLSQVKDEEQRRRAAWQQTCANCLLVANQAYRWKADLFAVAAESYVVGNKLGYQGKLVAAMVNTRARLENPLAVIYSTGKGDDLAAVVYGSKAGTIPEEAYDLLDAYADKEDRKALRQLNRLGVLAIRISVGQAKTDNKMWRNDPEQKLFYSGAVKWARRRAPEVILGVMTDDGLERMQMHMPGHQPELRQLIPSTLDTNPPPEIAQEVNSQAVGDKPQDAPQTTEPVATDQQDQTETPQSQTATPPSTPSTAATGDDPALLDEYAGLIADADTIEKVTGFEEHAKANAALSPTQVNRVLEMGLTRKAAIRSRRGQRANGNLPGMGS